MPAENPTLMSANRITIPVAILLSGISWYLSCGLSGSYWWLLWLAPIPILWICFQVRARHAFFISLTAYLIGRLSWLSYLLAVLPLPLAILFTILLPLVFALLVVQTRRVVLARPHWTSMFVFPVLWTSFEYIAFIFSRDGTAASIGYTQSDFLPIIQITSIIGLPGLVFLVTLLPSAVATAIYYREHKKSVKDMALFTTMLLVCVIIFGVIRVYKNDVLSTIKVGMASMEEALHEETNKPDSAKEMKITGLYVDAVSTLAKQGAQLIVLPEKAITVNQAIDTSIVNMLTKAATLNHVSIIVGITKVKSNYRENTALVISANGKVVADYMKVNLFELESLDGFRPGNTPATFALDSVPSGLAICKDLDFEHYIRKYNEADIQVFFVPAWDFVQDDWLHSRMAIMRGVENGYSMVRVARLGRLTITNDRGQVLHEANSANGRSVMLTGTVPLNNTSTLYGETGDWFAVVALLASLYFLIFTRKKI
jgi:apolipoprotein N-acyltransferase